MANRNQLSGMGKISLQRVLLYQMWHVYRFFNFETMVYYHCHMVFDFSWGKITLFLSQLDNSSITWMESGTHGKVKMWGFKWKLKFHPAKILMFSWAVESRMYSITLALVNATSSIWLFISARVTFSLQYILSVSSEISLHRGYIQKTVSMLCFY